MVQDTSTNNSTNTNNQFADSNQHPVSNIFFDQDGLRVDLTHGGTGDAIETSTPLSANMQAAANQPATDPNGLDQETMEFLRSVMSRVYSGEINIYVPSSLINQGLYETFSESAQGKADQTAFVFCAKLREIKGLMDISGGEQMYVEPTYQLKHLIKELKFHKETYEREHGNIFVI